MLNSIIRKFQYGRHTVTLETGMIARHATSSVMVTMDDTSVLVTVVVNKTPMIGQKFFPLTINYQERTYAAGRIPGGFFRREGRPSENEILISRLIDRPIRPLFPKGFCNEVQIIATVVSVNAQINPDIVAIIGTSAVLKLSGIPFLGPIGAARVGYIDNKYVLNPTVDEMQDTKLDLVVSGTQSAILMVEAEVSLLNEQQVLDAILFGHQEQQVLIENIISFFNEVGKESLEYISYDIQNHKLFSYIFELSKSKIIEAYCIFEKKKRSERLEVVKNDIIKFLQCQDIFLEEYEFQDILFEIERMVVRKRILKSKCHIDGRKIDIIRSLDIRIGILPRVHGSSLFTRGDTQSLVSTTLGTSRDAQNLDELLGDRIDNFLFHYNFPSYSIGEIGIVGSPKRREIGHGRLAKRSLLAIMPKLSEFPYTIRVVSEITESNGSSSMASVCGASLALMDAGVPIKSHVAGISMGLIKEGEDYVILSDILGDEDHFGDMDFKVAGNEIGITAFQMDMKIEGITNVILKNALYEAKKARIYILDKMKEVLDIPRRKISKFAPRIHIIKINPVKIKDVIGKGGSVIRMLTEETGTVIEIQDDGTVKISASMERNARHAIQRIEEITEDIKVGKIYQGKVIRITDFGAFISLGIGKEGLVHISQISNKRVQKVTDHLNLEQIVSVKVLEVDRQGRLRLSMKDL